MVHQHIPAQAGHTPVRTCIGCRGRAAKRELLRVTVGSGADAQAVLPDPTAIATGRGAHLHPTRECFDLAVRRKAFARALRHETGLSTSAVADYLDSLTTPDRPTRNWSSSS